MNFPGACGVLKSRVLEKSDRTKTCRMLLLSRRIYNAKNSKFGILKHSQFGCLAWNMEAQAEERRGRIYNAKNSKFAILTHSSFGNFICCLA